MAEQDRESLRKFLAEEAGKDRILKQSQEEIRQDLENRARQAIGIYRQEFEELTPLAQEKVGAIVQPWFDDLVQDGTYDQLLEWQKTHNGAISVSESILYYWPTGAFRSFKNSEKLGKKPFEGNAEFIVEKYEDHQEGIKKHQSGVDEVWSARFNIGWGGAYDVRQRGLYISQSPSLGGGYGFTAIEIPIDVKNVSATIPSIHPEVWIGFADQVEKGKTLELLQESLIPKPIRTIKVGSAEHTEIQRRSHARREEYLRAKKARGDRG